MLFTPYLVHGDFILPFVCFVISAKWTRELGYGWLWQLVAAICGFVLGPIMLLLLYLPAPGCRAEILNRSHLSEPWTGLRKSRSEQRCCLSASAIPAAANWRKRSRVSTPLM